MKIGEVQIDGVIDGEAVVPGPTFYPKTTDQDWLNRAEFLEPVMGQAMHLNTLGGYLLRYDSRVVLVDTGAGPRPTFPFVGGALRSALAGLGVRREDVTDVIFTHLHFDHIGWASVDGKLFFPRATYRVDRRDYDFYVTDGYVMPPEETALCNPQLDHPAVKLAPAIDQLELFEGEQQVIPGIRALEASGHTPGETVLEIESRGARGLLLGDLAHAQPELLATTPEERLAWEFIGHIDHAAANASLVRIQEMIIADELPFAAAHFAGLRWSTLRDRGDRLEWTVLPVDTEWTASRGGH
jgi:glyoxylase-like metal-dependent hydrolase (beta-lactamase superfamily II)